MTPAIAFEELLAWSEEAARYWKAHLDANPSLLELPCGIGGTATVQELVRHIGVWELRWAQRLVGVPETSQNVYLKIDNAILWNAAKVSYCVKAHHNFMDAPTISSLIVFTYR